MLHRVLAAVAATLACAAALVDARPAANVTTLPGDIDAGRDHISAPDLAERIMRGDQTLRVFDVRSRADYDAFHVPTAEHATLDDLLRASFAPGATVVVYSEGSAPAAQAWALLRMRGLEHVFVLREGVYEWIARIHEPRLASDATPAERAEFERVLPTARFFGGVAQTNVPRSEMPDGYWAHQTDRHGTHATPGGRANAAQAIARIRRRGC